MTIIIGMDPHKRSATIEIVDERARILTVGRCTTDKAGYAQMLAASRRYPDRIWAVEGCNGIGGPGRAIGDDSAIQRDRPNPGHRLFGQATSRTRVSPS